MKSYLVALAMGLLVGAIYGLFQVRSPAPPVVALVGLLGILLGEQLPPLVRQWLDKPAHVAAAAQVSWLQHQVRPHMFGPLPCRQVPAQPATGSTSTASIASTPSSGDSAHG